MQFSEIYMYLASMLIGALIGTERQRRIEEDKTTGVAGLRTFILISMLGTLSAGMATEYGPTFMVVAFGSFAILVGIGYATASKIFGRLDFTSAVAAAVTFILGALCQSEDKILLAASLSILVTLVLATRRMSHRYVEEISDTELLDTLKMGIIAVVILPLLPNQTLDPYEVLNPRLIWMMVVLVSLISYAGYILIKVMGEQRGLTLTGFLGGLVSSTAVATTMASETRSNSAIMGSAAFATAIASCTMFPRVLLITLFVNSELFLRLALTLSIMGITGIGLAYKRHVSEEVVERSVQHKDPFRIVPAIKFGAFFALILITSKLASIYFGEAGIYAASIIGGLADVDAITLSMATLAKTSISPSIAATSIVLATITNTLVKLAISYIMGSRAFGNRMAEIFIPMIAVGLIVDFII
jgi:uncharacterized membrane protein (DUF4010 family)